MEPIQTPQNPITPDFIEAMVDKIIVELSQKLEQLDISMDYIAASLLDIDPLSLGSTQAARGRHGSPADRTKHRNPSEED